MSLCMPDRSSAPGSACHHRIPLHPRSSLQREFSWPLVESWPSLRSAYFLMLEHKSLYQQRPTGNIHFFRHPIYSFATFFKFSPPPPISSPLNYNLLVFFTPNRSLLRTQAVQLKFRVRPARHVPPPPAPSHPPGPTRPHPASPPPGRLAAWTASLVLRSPAPSLRQLHVHASSSSPASRSLRAPGDVGMLRRALLNSAIQVTFFRQPSHVFATSSHIFATPSHIFAEPPKLHKCTVLRVEFPSFQPGPTSAACLATCTAWERSQNGG
jgi:hypothetical protein